MTLETGAAQLALQKEGTDLGDLVDDFGRRLARLRELTQSALAEMRALIFELRPGALREERLASTIREHADAVGGSERTWLSTSRRRALDPGPDAEEQIVSNGPGSTCQRLV